MFNGIKNDISKSIVFVLSIIVFVVGIVATIVNSNETYALSVDDYHCGTGNTLYEKNDNYYCCPSNYELTFVSSQYSHSGGGLDGYMCSNGELYGTAEQAEEKCSYDSYGDFSTVYHCVSTPTKATINSYTISYSSLHSNHNNSITVTAGQSVTLPIPNEDSYDFEYWKDGNTGERYAAGDVIYPKSNMEFVAVWKAEVAQTYTITYDANGGTGAPASQKIAKGENATLSSTKPTKDGYDFKFWEIVGRNKNLEPGKSYNLDDFVSNGTVELKAVWVKSDGGSDDGSSSTTIEPITSTKSLRYMKDTTGAKCYASADTSSTVVMKPTKCAGIYIADTNDSDWKYSTTHKCYIESSYVVKSKPSSCSSTSGGNNDSTGDNGGNNDSTGDNGGNNGSTGDNGGNNGSTGDNGGNNGSTGDNGGNNGSTGDKTDQELKDPDKIQTGDALIYTVWVVGLGALGYSLYYFMKRRNSL